MTQEQKDLLLKDLCSRLPYGVKCYGFQMKIDGNDNECYGVLKNISNKDSGWEFVLSDRVPLNNKKCYQEDYHEVKPYLFPLSSMTDKQEKELNKIYSDEAELIAEHLKSDISGNVHTHRFNHHLSLNWYLKNHIDIYGLIPMGLAIDASNLNIY